MIEGYTKNNLRIYYTTFAFLNWKSEKDIKTSKAVKHNYVKKYNVY